MLGSASLLTDVSSEMIHAVLPLFLVGTLGASTAFVGLIEGLGEAVASIVKLFSGMISDYFRTRKPLIVFGYGLSSVVKILFAVAQAPAVVLLARCLDRLGKGIRGAPRDAYIADVTPLSLRGAAYGLRQSMDSIGAFIGPLAAFVLLFVLQSDYRHVFWFALIPGLIAVLVLAAGIKEKRHPEDTNDKRRKNPLDPAVLSSFGKRFWWLFAIVLVFTLGNSSDAFLLLKLKQVGVPPSFVPLGLVLINITYSIFAYPIGRLSDTLGRRGFLLCSFALYAAVYTGFAFANFPWQVWLLDAVYGCYLAFSQSILLAMLADTVPKDMRGTAFGFINLSIGIGLIPASLLAGWLWQTVSPMAAFLAGAVFAALAFLMFAATDIGRQSASEAAP